MITKREILNEQGQTVAISNELIQKARFELTKTELKALLYMISKIKPQDKPETGYTFNAENFCRVCNLNLNGGWSKARARDTIMLLKSRVVSMPLSDSRMLITSWFSDAVLDNNTGEITIYFSSLLKPYLYELQQYYTSSVYEYIAPMESEYGIRLFLYLKSVKYKQYKCVITLDELRERLGCEGKYTQSSDIRSRIIEPAVKDINKYTAIALDYKLIKTGKKITHIEFNMGATATDERAIRMLARIDALGMR